MKEKEPAVPKPNVELESSANHRNPVQRPVANNVLGLKRPLLKLQREIGNQMVMRLLHSALERGRQSSDGPDSSAEPRLNINQPGDRFEREADAMAEKVMRMRSPDALNEPRRGSHSADSLDRQRTRSEEEEEATKKLQRKSIGAGPGVAPAIVHEVLRSPGHPLDALSRAFMEPRFGHDFSGVRVHSGSRAAESAKAIHARAFTVGHNVVFGDNQFDPGSDQGKKLLAHELAHVVQQSGGRVPEQESCNGEQGTGGLSVAPKDLVQLVELTYDDGPDSAGNTRRILDTLRSTGAHATFYLVGLRVIEGDNWRVVFDIAASGNWLGNHSFDWNNATDNHIFMHGPMEERARKILITEWAIRDALVRGKADAQQRGTWSSIPQTARAYIDDVIAHGTGRFRTPGFRSHIYSPGGVTQQAAIEEASRIATAAGLRAFVASDRVDVDPEDWRTGRTQADIETGVQTHVSSPTDSILLHSRVGATAAATPGIIADMQSRVDSQGNPYTFTEGPRGQLGGRIPTPPFAGLASISNPPTHAEIMTARQFLMANLSVGPVILSETALGIFHMAQAAGQSEVRALMSFLETTPGPPGTGYMTNFLYQSPTFRLFYEFLTNWINNRAFPRGPGVTY